MPGSDVEEEVELILKRVLEQYEIVSNALKKSEYIFYRIVEMSYHGHKIDLNRGSSYIKSPNWLKNKHCMQ